MGSNDLWNDLNLRDLNPFAPKFNNHLLIIMHAANNWASLDEVSRNELTTIINELRKFSKETNIATYATDPEQTKVDFGVRYAQLMKWVTNKQVYVESLKDWALGNESSTIKDIFDKTGITILAGVGVTDEIYEASVLEILESEKIDSESNKYLVARLDLLRRANKLMEAEELAETNGESR